MSTKKQTLLLGSRILRAGFLLGLVAALSACGLLPSKYKEAPVLQEKVRAGLLPPVDSRLPENPLVQKVVDSIGTLGGTMRGVWKGREDRWGPGKMAEEYLLMLNPTGTGLEANLVEAWKISDDNKIFTFTLRKGLRWSDGMPFTTSDILFFWEHILPNKEVYGTSIPSWLYSPVSKKLAVFEVKDEQTFTFTFDDSYGLFPYLLTVSGKDFFAAEHYYRGIFPEFLGEEKALAKAKELGYSSIKEMLQWQYQSFWVSPGAPTLRAWMAVTGPEEKHFILERNPYFWKVDEAGQQLPYIDKIDLMLTKNNDVIRIKTLIGDIDYQHRHMSNKKTLEPGMETGDYHLSEFITPGRNLLVFQPNLTVQDPYLRTLFNDVRFRQALSLAIDRKYIQEKWYPNNTEVSQFGPGNTDRFYSEKLAKAYVEYDPEQARGLLDEIGLPSKGNRAFRTRPDGKPLLIYLDLTDKSSDPVDQVVKYWADIGLNVEIRVHSKEGFEQRIKSNDLQLGYQSAETFNFIIQPSYLIPTTVSLVWPGQYALWFQTNGAEGLDPPAEYKKLVATWGELAASSSDETVLKQKAQEIMDLYAENLWLIAALTEYAPSYAVVKNNMKNVPSGLPNADSLRTPGNARLYQFSY